MVWAHITGEGSEGVILDQCALNPKTNVCITEEKTEEKPCEDVKTHVGGTQPRAQGRLEPQKLQEAGRTLPWSLWREHSPAHLDLSVSALPRPDLSGPAPTPPPRSQTSGLQS